MPSIGGRESVGEWVQLGRSAMRGAPTTWFADLLPHLLRRADEPVEYRHPISTHLANVLEIWHGSLWWPYLFETPQTFGMRHRVGPATLGEFIAVAIAVADPSLEPIAPVYVEAPTATERLRLDIEQARATLARLAALDELPPPPILRDAATSVLGWGGDIALGELLPDLAAAADEPIDGRLFSKTLPRVLSLWHGSRWEPYLAETVASIDRRRNCGPTTTGALLWLAVRRSRGFGSSA